MNQVQSSQTALAPLTKSLRVSLSLETAFNLFTVDIGRWWPLASHSIFGDDAVSCHLEGKLGGRLYEVHKDHREADWGKVLVWEPPQRVMFSMHPGRPEQFATEVEVTFQSEANGTRVTLIHRGWECRGERALIGRNSYNSGWDIVLAKFVDRSVAST